MRIHGTKFGGMRPAVEAYLLDDGEAQIARNVRLDTGALRGLPPITAVVALTKPTVDTLWRYPGADDTEKWLEFEGRADVARSPIAQDVWDRIYWTDSDGAHYGPAANVLSGASLPGTSYKLGIPAPATQPLISDYTPLADSGLESRTYRERFVSAYDEEGPMGPAAAFVDLDPDEAVTLSNLSAVPSGNYNITKRQIWRSSFVGGSSAVWQLVDEIPVAQLSYVDTKSQATISLNPTMTGEFNNPPPDGCIGLRITENGVAIVGKGREVYFSEQFLPHAFNPAYIKVLQHDFVAAAVFGQAVVVLTKGNLYVGAGIDPAGIQLTRVPESLPCLSAAGVVEGRGGCVYPSPEGLIAVGADFVPVNVSAQHMNQEQWLAYNPASFIASVENGCYNAWFERTDGTVGRLMFDLSGRTAPLVEASQSAAAPVTAAYHDETSDFIYVASDGQIRRVEKSGVDQPFLWRSREYRFIEAQIMAAFVVIGDAGTVTFTAYQNGVLRFSKTLPANEVSRMSTGRMSKHWTFQLEASTKITEFRVAPSVQELFE